MEKQEIIDKIESLNNEIEALEVSRNTLENHLFNLNNPECAIYDLSEEANNILKH